MPALGETEGGYGLPLGLNQTSPRQWTCARCI